MRIFGSACVIDFVGKAFSSLVSLLRLCTGLITGLLGNHLDGDSSVSLVTILMMIVLMLGKLHLIFFPVAR